MMEQWDILDRDGNKTGGLVERGQPLREGDYHLVVDIWIKNKDGQYLISRRAPHKQPDPGLWEPTCGCAVAGDTSLSAAMREVREELGLALDPAMGRRVRRFIIPGTPDIVDVWLFTQEFDIDTVVFQQEETDAAEWASADKIRRLAADGMLLSARRLPYLEDLLNGSLTSLCFRAACLMTHNIDEMVAFYTKLFAHAPEVDGGVDFRFSGEHVTVFKLTDKNEPSTHDAALIYSTEDADMEYERLAALGIAHEPPTDKPWGVRSFILRDPDGNMVSIAAPAR